MKWFWPMMSVLAIVSVWFGDLPIWWLRVLATIFFICTFAAATSDAVGTSHE